MRRSPQEWVSALIRKALGSPLVPSTMWGREKTSTLQSGRRLHQNATMLTLWSWTTQPSEWWETHSVVYKPLSVWCFVVAAWVDQDTDEIVIVFSLMLEPHQQHNLHRHKCFKYPFHLKYKQVTSVWKQGLCYYWSHVSCCLFQSCPSFQPVQGRTLSWWGFIVDYTWPFLLISVEGVKESTSIPHYEVVILRKMLFGVGYDFCSRKSVLPVGL